LLYLFITFSVFVAGLEKFWAQQVFSFLDFSFLSYRGLLNGLSLILTFLAVSVPMSIVVKSYKNMLDYCFTIFVIHFIVVSIVELDFPANGAWWTSIGIGLIFCMLTAERLSYQLSTMTYQSSLGEKKSKVELTEVKEPKQDGNINIEDISISIEKSSEATKSPQIKSPKKRASKQKNEKKNLTSDSDDESGNSKKLDEFPKELTKSSEIEHTNQI